MLVIPQSVQFLHSFSGVHFPNYSEDQLVKVSNLQLTKLSVKNMDLSAVPVQTLAKVAARAHTLDVSNTSLTPTQANAIFTALVNNCDAKEIDFCDNSLSLVPPENIAMAVAKSRTVLLANTSLKMTVRGTMVRSEVCNSWCFCLES